MAQNKYNLSSLLVISRCIIQETYKSSLYSVHLNYHNKYTTNLRDQSSREVEEAIFLPPPAFPGMRCRRSSEDPELPETPDSLLDSRDICLLTTLLFPPGRDITTELAVL
jgi:hypothetical protein